MPRLEGRHTCQSRQLGLECASQLIYRLNTRSAAMAAAILLITLCGFHVPWPGQAPPEYRGRCGIPCASATDPRPEPVKGTPGDAGRAAGAATRRPATTEVGAGGELPPSCPKPLK